MFASLATGLLLKFQFATSATPRQLPQTPTLIGCKFLMITRDSHLPNSAAISEALYYNTLLDDVKEIFKNLQILTPLPSPGSSILLQTSFAL